MLRGDNIVVCVNNESVNQIFWEAVLTLSYEIPWMMTPHEKVVYIGLARIADRYARQGEQARFKGYHEMSKIFFMHFTDIYRAVLSLSRQNIIRYHKQQQNGKRVDTISISDFPPSNLQPGIAGFRKLTTKANEAIKAYARLNEQGCP